MMSFLQRATLIGATLISAAAHAQQQPQLNIPAFDIPAFDIPELDMAPQVEPSTVIVQPKVGSADILTAQEANEFLSEAEAQALNLVPGPEIRSDGALEFDVAPVISSMEEESRTNLVNGIVEQLNAREDVEYAQPNFVLKPHRIPNDPLFVLQWHYFNQNGGSHTSPGGVELPVGWDSTTGDATVYVAVIDTGQIFDLPDVGGSPNLAPGYDMISDANRANDGNGRDPDPTDAGDAVGAGECGPGSDPEPNSWHGTHVAGTIGAGLTDNGQDLAGVAWNVSVLPVRVLGKCGGTIADINDGIRWAAGLDVPGTERNQNPAKIINMSLGATNVRCSESPATQDAIDDATRAGALVIVSAGNSRNDASNNLPAGCENVFTVAASDARGHLASRYSSFGPAVDALAPGGDVKRDDNGDKYPDGVLSFTKDGPAFYNGTSMAAPHASGLAALRLAISPDLTPDQLADDLKRGALPRSTEQCPNPCGAGLLTARFATAVAGTAGERSTSLGREVVAEVTNSVSDAQPAIEVSASGSTQAAAAAGTSYRHDWGDLNGQWKLNLNWPAVTPDSRVFAAIGECTPAGDKALGAAKYTVHNIAPSEGKVSIWIDVDWGSPVRVCADYLVVNP